MIESRIVDPYVESYVKSLVSESEGLLKALELYAEQNHVPIVQTEVAQFLRVFIKIHKPKAVLEIGTAIGYSGALIAKEMDGGIIDTIELKEEMFEFARNTFEKLNEEGSKVKINQYLGDASDVLSTLERKYDLIFIDASKGHYQAFFDLCYPLLNPGGVILSDNVLYKGMIATNHYLVRRKITIVKRMRKYLQFITTHPELETTVLPMGDGLAISYKKGGNA